MDCVDKTVNLTFDEKLNDLFTDANVLCWKEFDEKLEIYRNEITGEKYDLKKMPNKLNID